MALEVKGKTFISFFKSMNGCIHGPEFLFIGVIKGTMSM